MQHAAHDDAVAREGADEGIITCCWDRELEDFLLATVEQLGVMKDVVAFRDETVFKTFGSHDDGGIHDGIGLAGFNDEQVMRHHIGVGKSEFDLFTGLHGEFFDVIHQSLRHGADTKRGEFRSITENARFLGFFFLLSCDDAALGAGFDVEPKLLDDVGCVAGVQFRLRADML